jgi:hypothetical protein
MVVRKQGGSKTSCSSHFCIYVTPPGTSCHFAPLGPLKRCSPSRPHRPIFHTLAVFATFCSLTDRDSDSNDVTVWSRCCFAAAGISQPQPLTALAPATLAPVLKAVAPMPLSTRTCACSHYTHRTRRTCTWTRTWTQSRCPCAPLAPFICRLVCDLAALATPAWYKNDGGQPSRSELSRLRSDAGKDSAIATEGEMVVDVDVPNI